MTEQTETVRDTVHESNEQLLRIIQDAPHAPDCAIRNVENETADPPIDAGDACNCFKSERKALMAQESTKGETT